MKAKILAFARNWVAAFLYPRPLVGVFYLPRYFSHLVRYAGKNVSNRIRFWDLQPCLGDWSTHTPFDAHYFYQGAWLARKLKATSPPKHVDVGSSVLSLSVISAWTEVVFVDYRPLKGGLPGLTSVAGNILQLPFADASLGSLSCLHVIEHIGLGRYGDPLDPEGSVSAALELQRVLRPGGVLYLSLPIGRERVCFNAHRVHSPATVSELFRELELIDFSYVDDEGVFHQSQPPCAANDLQYGCGCFVFIKPSSSFVE